MTFKDHIHSATTNSQLNCSTKHLQSMLCNALQSQISNDVHLQQSHGKQTSIFQILRSVSEHTLWYHARQACHKETDMDLRFAANIEFRVPYSQRYLFYAIPDTNHNANPTNPNCNSKGNPNPTNSTNPNTSYRCEYGTLNSMFDIMLYGAVRSTWECAVQ